MVKLQKGKFEALERLSDDKGIIAALAIDQRGSLKKMIATAKGSIATIKELEEFKSLVAQELTPYASAILLDPEYGIPASKKRDKNCGLLSSYEKTGYDTTQPGRLPDLLANWSAKRLKEEGGDAVKLLVYYDPDEGDDINDVKKAFIERVGSECKAEDIPFFLEIVTYDTDVVDAKSAEYAKLKPKKVLDSVKVFTQDRYGVDVLKLEVPVDMSRVEGVGDKEPVYTAEEAKKYFQEVEKLTTIPYIWLSAGVATDLFQKTLIFAREAGSKYNGVLCGRATWREGVADYGKDGEKGLVAWLRSQGKKNMEDLNAILEKNATPWYEVYGGKNEIELV